MALEISIKALIKLQYTSSTNQPGNTPQIVDLAATVLNNYLAAQEPGFIVRILFMQSYQLSLSSEQPNGKHQFSYNLLGVEIQNNVLLPLYALQTAKKILLEEEILYPVPSN